VLYNATRTGPLTYDKRSVREDMPHFQCARASGLMEDIPVPLFLTMPDDLWQVEETGNPLVALVSG